MSEETMRQDGVGRADELDRLWTPHRMAYIRGADKPVDATSEECPFCRIPQLPDEEGLVVRRGALAYAVLNLYPYSPGHLMICPYRHIAEYTETSDEEAAEIATLTKEAMSLVRPPAARRRRRSTSPCANWCWPRPWPAVFPKSVPAAQVRHWQAMRWRAMPACSRRSSTACARATPR